MKRLITLIFVLAISITTFAQIQTQILGMTLGSTTKQSALNILKQKGYKIKENTSTNIDVEGVNFGGVKWRYTSFNFYKGKLLYVYFHINSLDIEISTIDAIYDRVNGNLMTKYKKYYDAEYSPDNGCAYIDNKVWLETDRFWSQNVYHFYLQYTYMPLDDQRRNDAKNEL